MPYTVCVEVGNKAQRKPEDTAIDQIVQLLIPLSADEHDHVVNEMESSWGKTGQREPWWHSKPLVEDRRDFVLETQQKVLALAERLKPDEQGELLEELKLVWLRRALRQGEESLKKQGGIPADEVFERLQAKYKRMKEEQEQ